MNTESSQTNTIPMYLPLSAGAIEGELIVPNAIKGVVIFAHGSGSSRFSPRNQRVAQFLRAEHLGTLLLDLLTPQEAEVDELTREYRFDIPFLAERLMLASEWLAGRDETRTLPFGYFGASTGAAAALIAAANAPERVQAIVSRGGRPDLAEAALEHVAAPTLLIVGGRDPEVLELNRQALELLRCERHLEIVTGATHLFEEPGALERVTRLATDWFVQHLRQPA